LYGRRNVTIADELLGTFAAASLLALWAVLPMLLLAYVHQRLLVRPTRSDFALRKSETMELNRAVDLYEDVCGRIEAIRSRAEKRSRIQLFFRNGRPAGISQDCDELEDLEAHAHLLRATIVRLKTLPLSRLRSWLRLRSSTFAIGGAIVGHVLTLTFLSALPYVLAQSALAGDFTGELSQKLGGYPFDERLCTMNAAASAVAAILGPLLYLARMRALKRRHDVSLCMYRDLAKGDLSKRVEQAESDETDDPESRSEEHSPGELTADDNWLGVFGLKHPATLDEIKETYKTLIKQSHPDRVQGLSPALRTLAETETKRLNQAYEQALRAHSFAE
jgi:DnaJ domain